jgi:hypothetical protein
MLWTGRQSVKKVIELLEGANTILATISPKLISLDSIRLPVAISNIQKAIAELKTPRRYTPEQWLERTGEPWPEDGAVYYRYSSTGDWALLTFNKDFNYETSEYLCFEELEAKPKTKQFAVKNKTSDFILGYVKWYGPWRCYCLFIDKPGLVFDAECLADIQDFLKSLMLERLQKKET